MADEKIPPRIHVLAKPTGATCNLNCSYCFFLNKEQLYPGSHFRMSDAVLEHFRQLIESHRTDKVTVAWQGGEPTLMGLDFYRRAIEYQNHYQRTPLAAPSWRRCPVIAGNARWDSPARVNVPRIGFSPRRMENRG